MVYLDTNVLIYGSVDQNKEKRERSLEIIEGLIEKSELVLSTLVLQEFVFTMAKLKIDNKIIQKDSDFYMNFVTVEHDHIILEKAIFECCKSDSCKNLNDIMHVYLAETSKSKQLFTFDSDFRNIAANSRLQIVIL
jgi:predicted nucleic acid-binding protein